MLLKIPCLQLKENAALFYAILEVFMQFFNTFWKIYESKIDDMVP